MRRLSRVVGVFLVGLVASGPVRAAEIRWLADATPQAVEVNGASRAVLAQAAHGETPSESAAGVLRVYVEAPEAGADKMGLPSMAGTWRVTNDRLRFEPAFPLAAGVRYRAEYRPPGEPPLVSFFELPMRKNGRPTEVVQVFPSGEVLPENQLKFYVQFSAPMSRGGTSDHVRLRDAEGRVVELPFLDLDEELWDPAMTRLTLLIDPGRIKRGVKPLEDIGPVFEEGKRYTLTLDAACRDAAGQPLREKFEKSFRIGPADRTPPDPQRWRIEAPKAGTRDSLRVSFDEPLDHALALRLIRVAGAEARGAFIAGEPTLEAAERRWVFAPASPWGVGRHRLVVATTIEDLAGNNIGKTFDVDLAAGAQRRLAAENVDVFFEVK